MYFMAYVIIDSSFNELNTNLKQWYVELESFGNDVISSIHALNSSYSLLVESHKLVDCYHHD